MSHQHGCRFEEIDAPLIGTFLDASLEKRQSCLSAVVICHLPQIHFFLFGMPLSSLRDHSARSSGCSNSQPAFHPDPRSFLTRAEVDALLAVPDIRTWSGRRDHAFLFVAVQRVCAYPR